MPFYERLPVAVTEPRTVRIGDHLVGDGEPVFVIAEISANHNHSLDRALELVDAAAAAGADAVKIQTYRPDTITLDSDEPAFRVGEGTLWSGQRLYDLYADAMTPWEWTGPLMERAAQRDILLFSTPFDSTAVDFLETFEPPAYKIASFELVDVELIRTVAATRRPIILSTGMASIDEIDLAVATAVNAGAAGVILLRCNSGYPAAPDEMDLRTIGDMRERWDLPIGLSDHTLGIAAAVASVALGAAVIEKHLTFSRDEPGPDSAFSLEPNELRGLVEAVRTASAALGAVRYGPSAAETKSLAFRRSLFAVADIAEGEELTRANVRSIRPGQGLPPRLLPEVLGRRAARPIKRGTPLSFDLLA